MPYIGRDTDKLSNVEVLDNITFDGSSSYTLQKGGSNFTPSSANTLLVSIDGVVQAGNFTVSGSTIDFGTAVAGTSTCDFILHYGTGLITTPADGTVTEAKIGSGAVTSAKLSYPLTTFSSTGIDDNATSTAVEIDSSNDLNMLSGNKFIANRADNTRNISLYNDDNAGYVETSFDPLTLKSADRMDFETNGSQRMRIDSSGRVKVGTTSSNRFFHIKSNINSEYILTTENTESTPYGMLMQYSGGSPDSSVENFFFYALDSTTARFIVYSDGDVKNHDNSYGAISDERIKQDIRDSNSQWNDIKNIRVRNFKKKDDVRQYGENAWEQIGVIAQELETVSPKLIKHTNPSPSDILSDASFGTLYEEGDEIPEGKKIGDVKEIHQQVKGVSYSVLYMKAIKALQEAMERIETLETKNTELEARITALESE